MLASSNDLNQLQTASAVFRLSSLTRSYSWRSTVSHDSQIFRDKTRTPPTDILVQSVSISLSTVYPLHEFTFQVNRDVRSTTRPANLLMWLQRQAAHSTAAEMCFQLTCYLHRLNSRRQLSFHHRPTE